MKQIAEAKHGQKGVRTKVPTSSSLILPPASTTRWVASRKAAVVAAVRTGRLTVDEACRRYQLSQEEFREWERHYEAEGVSGLRISTRLQGRDYPVH
jgi:transposase-like protein